MKNVDEPIKIYRIEIDHDFSDDSKPDRFPPRLKKVSYGIIVLIILSLAISFVYNSFRRDDLASYKEASAGNSIAVLPFEDLSLEQDQEYLGYGLAEEIINRLTKIEDLVVIGRTSSFSFKDKDTDLKTIGKMLGAETILEGSVRKSGDQLRITVQLINVKDASHIWSERFDRLLKDIFLLQDEIALIVATKINSNFIRSNPARINKNEQVDPEAYQCFLKGKHMMDQNDSNNREFENFFPKIESMFLEALKINPDYALAHAGLAELYITKSLRAEKDSLDAYKYKKLGHIQIGKAYAINPESDFVNQKKGWIHMVDGEADSAYHCLVNAIKIDAEDKHNYIALGYFLMTKGLYHEAALLITAAKKSNPLDMDLLIHSSWINFLLGNFKEGIEELETIKLLSPDNLYAHSRIFYSSVKYDSVHKVEEELEIIKEAFPERNFPFFEGLIYALKGDTAKALSISHDSWYYSILGMKEEYFPAFIAEYERSKESNFRTTHYYIWLKTRKIYEWLQEDPRTQKIIQEEKEQYELMKAKYGNLDFLDLR